MPVENLANFNDPLKARMQQSLTAVVQSFEGQWVEWGVVEFLYADANPADFATAISEAQGHRVQVLRDGRNLRNRMVSEQMSNSILAARVGNEVNRIFRQCTGAWRQWHGDTLISFWAPFGLAESAPHLTWDQFCQNDRKDLSPGSPDMGYMAYVPVWH